MIIRRCPFYDQRTTVATAAGELTVLPYQLIVWVGIRVGEVESNAIPTVIDTGHSHNFSVAEHQLREWGQFDPTGLATLGYAIVNGVKVPLKDAELLLFSNQPGTRDALLGAHRLSISQGIAVYPDTGGPRLPLLGVRAMASSGLRVTIDGRRRTFSIR